MKGLFQKWRRVILFGLAGGINTLVDVIVFSIVLNVAGLAVEYCQAIGYCSGVLCSFLINSRVTFKDGDVPVYQQVIKFVCANGLSLLVSTLGIGKLVDLGLSEMVAKLIVTLIVMPINYFVYKILVFRVKDK